MKKSTALLVLMACSLFLCHAQNVFGLLGFNIPLTVQVIHQGSAGTTPPKSPVEIPEAYLDDHTLYIGTAFDDDVTVQLVTVDDVTGVDTVEYSTVLYAGDQTVVFPSTLSGTYELRILVDWYYLAGEVEL